MLAAVEEFPAGVTALHPDWPEARFNVSGLFVYEPLILGCLKMMQQAFGCRPAIEAMHGAPAVRWNGGRIGLNGNEGVEQAIETVNAAGLGCFLTFTNHLLEPADLDDAPCNRLLERAARRPNLNGVIVANELLSDYIARHHPRLRQVASIVKVAVEGGRGDASYYQRLGARYSKYVVHPDDCFDLKLLDQLDRKKAEIIINENCVMDCQIRPRHYELIAGHHRALATSGPGSPAVEQAARDLADGTAGCISVPFTRQIGRQRRNCNFTRGELAAVYNMGFRQFKLQGRRDHVFGFLYDVIRYTLEPDVAAPLIYKTACTLIRFS